MSDGDSLLSARRLFYPAGVRHVDLMKRVTITLDDATYLQLLEYALERSKSEMRNISLSEAIRILLGLEFSRMGNAYSGQLHQPEVRHSHGASD